MFNAKIDDLNHNEAGIGFSLLDDNMDELRVPESDWRRKSWSLKRRSAVDEWHIIKLTKNGDKHYVLVGLDAETRSVVCIPDVDLMAHNDHAIRTIDGNIYYLLGRGVGNPSHNMIMKLAWMLRAHGFSITLRKMVVVQ